MTRIVKRRLADYDDDGLSVSTRSVGALIRPAESAVGSSLSL